MKKRFVIVSVSSTCVLASAVVAARPMPDKVSAEAIDPVSGVAVAAAGLNYSTSFEPGEGYPLGYISNTPGTYPAGCGGVAFPCWGHTTGAGFSLITPTIESQHPASGLQYLRLIHDPSTRTNIPNFGLGVDARFPRTADLSVRPIAANTVSVDIAISAPGGMNYRIQPQSISQGYLASSAMFRYDGSIYILDDECGAISLGFLPVVYGDWDTSGAYQNYTVAMDPCTNTMTYFYGGAQIYSSCVIAGTNLEQFLVFGDNYPGSMIDVDNVALQSLDSCPCICGNEIVENLCEECDGGADANCPGRCIPPGQAGECTCSAICTQANPCPVTNSANGPYITSDGYYLYSGESPSISIDTCGSSFDSFLSIATAAAPGTPLVSNDNCNAGPFGAGADESAPCYDDVAPYSDSYPSCTCLANPGQPILIRVQVISPTGYPALGYTTMINIRKKSVCEGPSVGACCDTNGPDTGCTDNVLQGACVGADKVWTENGKCTTTSCVCIPDCAGRQCGDDGCSGNCGTCDDGNGCTNDACGLADQCVFTNNSAPCNDHNACTGGDVCAGGACGGTAVVCNDGNACNGLESCNAILGCVPGTPLACDDGLFCDGEEFCVPIYGCQAGNSPCTENETCDEDTDQCVPNVIPTVSQWGLVVLTIVLLAAAKVRFARRGTSE